MTAAEYKRLIRDHLLRAYMLSDEKIDIFLPRFLTTLTTHLDNLQQPLQTRNLAELCKVAHTLKGALLNLGLRELADIAYHIELQSRAGDGTTDYLALVEQLHREINSFADADATQETNKKTILSGKSPE
ncbi:MAG TPA: Hpt domain-containing protein [Desulfobulbus sp.]|nr:Hpt domain-containing protein [Desulfobulbus sp.]